MMEPVEGVVQDIDETKEKVLRSIRSLISQGTVSRADILSALPGPKGRAAPGLPEFTFPSSGITVKVRRLGPFTLDAISSRLRMEIKRPDPPKVMVNYGDDTSPDMHVEDNLADPEYEEALAKYEKDIADAGGRKIIDTMVNHAVVVDVDLEEVSATRKFLEEMGLDKEELDKLSDHEIYVKHVCIKTGDDLTKLQEFVLGQSTPTEERIAAHEATFPSEVPRETTIHMASPNVGNEVQPDA